MCAIEKPVVAHSFFKWLPLTMTWAYNQLKYMNGFSPVVLTEKTQNPNQFPWNPVYSSSSNRYSHFLFRVLRKLNCRSYPFIYDRAIKIHKPIILHSHFGDRGWLDLPIASKYRLKHIITFYGYDVNRLPQQWPLWKGRYKELFDKGDLFLCEGPYMAKCLLGLGCPEEKVVVQRLGVEVDKIPFMHRKIGDDGLIKILIAGIFREKKGIPYALEAIGILKDKFPNIRVTVIGDSTGQYREEEEKKKILEVIKKYKLEPIIRMLGFQPHGALIEEAYNHHIFLSPSVTASDGDTEGGAPVTIIEMAASGMPVVSTWHCDIPEVVIDKVTGFLAKERDVQELCELLIPLFTNEHLMSKVGMAGNRYTENKFNIMNTVMEMENTYKSISPLHKNKHKKT